MGSATVRAAPRGNEVWSGRNPESRVDDRV